MIIITPALALDDNEITFTFIRSPGPGGQNVNKVETGVLLRFNVDRCLTLTEEIRERLIALAGNKITLSGDLIIKATRFRTQERNKQDALDRFCELVAAATVRPKKRRKTKPTKASVQRRLNHKKRHGQTKALRQRKPGDE